MGYSIKVLKNEDYDRLPFEFTRQSFAVTSPDKKNIFVRHTNLHDFNKMLVSHELDHLVEEVPTDEGPQGERYFLSGLLSGLGKIGSSIFGGLLGGGAGAGGGLMSNLIGGLGKQAVNAIAPNNPLAQFAGSLIPGGGGSSGGSNSGNRYLSPQQLQYQNSMNGIGGGSGSGMFGNLLGGLTKGLGGIMGLFGKPQTQLGTGMLAGGLMYPQPKFPNFSNVQSVQNFKNTANAGGNPLMKQAEGVISGNLNKEFQPLSQPEIDAALRQLDKEQMYKEEYTRNIYRGLGRSPDPIEDRQFNNDISQVQQEYAQRKADTLANLTRQSENYFNQNQQANLSQARGLGQEQINLIAEVAQMDISEIMAKFGVDESRAQYIKNVLVELGGNLTLSGMNSQPFFGFNAGGQ